MTFDEHVQKTQKPDGSFDLAEAAKSRLAELEQDEQAAEEMLRKAVESERRRWESRNRDYLKKQFGAQLTLDLGELDLEAKVPLGDDIVMELGSMGELEVRKREHLRTQSHLVELRAFDTEMTFWERIRELMPPGGNIGGIPGAAP